MIFIRQKDDIFRILPETDEEQKQLETALGWKNPNTLMEIICKLKGYGIEEE